MSAHDRLQVVRDCYSAYECGDQHPRTAFGRGLHLLCPSRCRDRPRGTSSAAGRAPRPSRRLSTSVSLRQATRSSSPTRPQGPTGDGFATPSSSGSTPKRSAGSRSTSAGMSNDRRGLISGRPEAPSGVTDALTQAMARPGLEPSGRCPRSSHGCPHTSDGETLRFGSVGMGSVALIGGRVAVPVFAGVRFEGMQAVGRAEAVGLAGAPW